MRKLSKSKIELAERTIAWLRNPAYAISADLRYPSERTPVLGEHPGIGMSLLPGYSNWKEGRLSNDRWAEGLEALVASSKEPESTTQVTSKRKTGRTTTMLTVANEAIKSGKTVKICMHSRAMIGGALELARQAGLTHIKHKHFMVGPPPKQIDYFVDHIVNGEL